MAMAQEVEGIRDFILLDDEEHADGFKAIIKEKQICEIGRQFLATLGDDLDECRESEQTTSEQTTVRESTLSRTVVHSLNYLLETLETVLEYVEQSTWRMMKDLQKKETVLRGIFNLTVLGERASFFAILDLAKNVLDVEEGQYEAEQEFISSEQEAIKQKQMHILKLVNEACELVKAIIKDKSVDRCKALQYNFVIRQADVAIGACKRHLDGIKEKTTELSNKMNTIKWFSRVARLTIIFTSGYIYKQLDQGSIMGIPRFVVTMGVLTLALFPSRLYKSLESLKKLENHHLSLRIELENLRDNLNSTRA